MRTQAVLLPMALGVAFVSGGCGLVSDNFDAELRVDFLVDAKSDTYENVLTVNPNDYPDVQENCGSIEKATGQIRTLTVEVLGTKGAHTAKYGWGSVFMRAASADVWSDDPTKAFAFFDQVPLITGQVVTLDMTPARRAQLADLVFTENCDQPLQLRLVGKTEDGSLAKFDGRVTFYVDFVASL